MCWLYLRLILPPWGQCYDLYFQRLSPIFGEKMVFCHLVIYCLGTYVHEGTTLFRITWFGITWFGITWFGIMWFGITWIGITWIGIIPIWYNVIWYNAHFGIMFFWSKKCNFCLKIDLFSTPRTAQNLPRLQIFTLLVLTYSYKVFFEGWKKV
jgi:hypothetical protein